MIERRVVVFRRPFLPNRATNLPSPTEGEPPGDVARPVERVDIRPLRGSSPHSSAYRKRSDTSCPGTLRAPFASARTCRACGLQRISPVEDYDPLGEGRTDVHVVLHTTTWCAPRARAGGCVSRRRTRSRIHPGSGSSRNSSVGAAASRHADFERGVRSHGRARGGGVPLPARRATFEGSLRLPQDRSPARGYGIGLSPSLSSE